MTAGAHRVLLLRAQQSLPRDHACIAASLGCGRGFFFCGAAAEALGGGEATASKRSAGLLRARCGRALAGVEAGLLTGVGAVAAKRGRDDIDGANFLRWFDTASCLGRCSSESLAQSG